MTVTPIYTDAELIASIKAIDIKLAKALSESEVDTQQNRQMFEIEVAELRKQRDYLVAERGRLSLKNSGAEIITMARLPRRYP